jgi:hypothetical protein
MLAAGVVFVGTQVFSFGVAGFARANVVIAIAAIAVATLLRREYEKLTRPAEPGRAEPRPNRLEAATVGSGVELEHA